MRRRNFKLIMLLATLTVTLCSGAAFAAGEDSPWKVRRPADNTVLPSEYVHRPGSAEELPGEGAGETPLQGRSVDSNLPGGDKPGKASTPAKSAKPEAPKADAPMAETPRTDAAKPAAPAPPSAASAASRGSLGRAGSLESSTNSAGLSLFLPLDRPAAAPHTFRLKEPARLVYDLKGAWDNVGGNVYRVDSPWVEKVVIGEHEEFLRVVVYLNEAAGVTDLADEVSFSPDGLRIALRAKR